MDLSPFGTKIAPKLSFLFIFCPSNDMVWSQVTSSYLDLLSQSSQAKITKSFLFYIFLAFINIVISAHCPTGRGLSILGRFFYYHLLLGMSGCFAYSGYTRCWGLPEIAGISEILGCIRYFGLPDT